MEKLLKTRELRNKLENGEKIDDKYNQFFETDLSFVCDAIKKNCSDCELSYSHNYFEDKNIDEVVYYLELKEQKIPIAVHSFINSVYFGAYLNKTPLDKIVLGDIKINLLDNANKTTINQTTNKKTETIKTIHITKKSVAHNACILEPKINTALWKIVENNMQNDLKNKTERTKSKQIQSKLERFFDNQKSEQTITK